MDVRFRSETNRTAYNHAEPKKSHLIAMAMAVTLTPVANAIASDHDSLSTELVNKITHHSHGRGLSAFAMPEKNDLANIPQDPANPITREKITLGRFLYHDTATGTKGNNPETTQTWSCASCHHVQAGFKAGVPQGIGEGGSGFGYDGSARLLAHGFNGNAPAGHKDLPDIQPLTSPTVLNTAYQDVMLWNGSFGNSPGGINRHTTNLTGAGPAEVMANTFGLSGLETQVLAGTRVHRLGFDNNSILQTNSEYQYLFDKAFPSGYTGYIPNNGTEVSANDLGAAKAIAAYERIILSNLAPFQRWLAGDQWAMSEQQLRGANLFFGKADCVSCHTGPALSSDTGATADDIFFAIGFNDFDATHPQVHGTVDDATKRGRGGFTGNAIDDYKFKIPQLYNLTDTNVFGHGASFDSVRAVIDYKNTGVAQNPASANNLSGKFKPLGLSHSEVDDLVVFIEDALYDSWLDRYVPYSVPSDQCFPVADVQSAIDLGCLIDSGDNTNPTGTPECQLSNSDPDGDGWGWENNKTCVVKNNNTTYTSSHAYCEYSDSDPDGDGWGWENNKSCKVSG